MATSKKFTPGDFVTPKHEWFADDYGFKKGNHYMVEPINQVNIDAGHNKEDGRGPWVWLTDKDGDQVGFPEDQFRLKKIKTQMDPDFSLDEIHQAQKALAKLTKNKASA